MGKERLPATRGWKRAEARRWRQWRACGVLSVVAVLMVGGFYGAQRYLHRDVGGGHVHPAAPHGGVVAPTGDEAGHYHVEAVVERGRTVKLYVYGEKLEERAYVPRQMLAAQMKADTPAAMRSLVLMPMPQAHDPEGKTSRFFGKLPRGVHPVAGLHIAGIDFGGRQLAVGFESLPPATEAGSDQDILLGAAGKYTLSDVRANGIATATQTYGEPTVQHDVRPKPGDVLCPVSLARASGRFRWVVGGKTYRFCCPPCIVEFVRRAKEQPDSIAGPERYVKR